MRLGELVVESGLEVSDDAPGPVPVSGFAGFIAVALLALFAPADGFIPLTPGPLAESVLGEPGTELPTGPELAPILVPAEPVGPIAPILVPALAPPFAEPLAAEPDVSILVPALAPPFAEPPLLSEPPPAFTPELPPAAPPPAPCANAFDVNAPSASDNVAPSRIEDTFFFFIVAFSFFRPRKNYPSHCGLADVPSKV
jgi:hypothetical protein